MGPWRRSRQSLEEPRPISRSSLILFLLRLAAISRYRPFLFIHEHPHFSTHQVLFQAHLMIPHARVHKYKYKSKHLHSFDNTEHYEHPTCNHEWSLSPADLHPANCLCQTRDTAAASASGESSRSWRAKTVRSSTWQPSSRRPTAISERMPRSGHRVRGTVRFLHVWKGRNRDQPQRKSERMYREPVRRYDVRSRVSKSTTQSSYRDRAQICMLTA
jgi:hypothetical protein